MVLIGRGLDLRKEELLCGFESRKIEERISGSESEEGTPVHIPNTEVKLLGADGT